MIEKRWTDFWWYREPVRLIYRRCCAINCHQYPWLFPIQTLHQPWYKTAKNEQFKFLKISLGTISVISKNTPKIYDGMVLLQKLPATLSMFGSISDFLINRIVKCSCRVYFFMTGYYLPNYIKSLERKSRSMIGLLQMKVSRRDQKWPQ